jgi:hypothetical protein
MIKFAVITTIGYLSLKIGKAIYPYFGKRFIPPLLNYVMVVGCTDGIGKEYAKYLSKLGIPLILVGRNQ